MNLRLPVETGFASSLVMAEKKTRLRAAAIGSRCLASSRSGPSKKMKNKLYYFYKLNPGKSIVSFTMLRLLPEHLRVGEIEAFLKSWKLPFYLGSFRIQFVPFEDGSGVDIFAVYGFESLEWMETMEKLNQLGVQSVSPPALLLDYPLFLKVASDEKH